MDSSSPTSLPAPWQLRSRTLAGGPLPALMGIVNVTPDSFSDGGQYFDPQRAIEHGLELAAAGADILDIGGESTRPYAQPVTAEEELRRTVSVVAGLARQSAAILSIDTSKAAIAQACLDAGAEIINDVTGLAGDPLMLPLAVRSQAGVCAMHMQGTPATMQDDPQYADVVEDIFGWLDRRRLELVTAGVARERICLDPGVGFGKTHAHNLALLAGARRFQDLGQPILWGPSRKGFIGKVLGDKAADRTAGTVGVCLALARQGAQVLRVHDVASVRQALLLFEASGGLR